MIVCYLAFYDDGTRVDYKIVIDKFVPDEYDIQFLKENECVWIVPGTIEN